ncbi:TetR/AcrR family transcriptional regulator, partial [Frigoribacterium sp. CFBP 13605]
MPTPDRTSPDAILLAARELLEADGPSGLTMAAVAARVGVRAPSLYKRVENREALLRSVAEATLTDLAARLDGAGSAREVLDAFRAFGHERPAAFQLVMTPGPGVPTARREFGAAA